MDSEQQQEERTLVERLDDLIEELESNDYVDDGLGMHHTATVKEARALIAAADCVG